MMSILRKTTKLGNNNKNVSNENGGRGGRGGGGEPKVKFRPVSSQDSDDPDKEDQATTTTTTSNSSFTNHSSSTLSSSTSSSSSSSTRLVLETIHFVEDLRRKDTSWGDVWSLLYFSEEELGEMKYEAHLEENARLEASIRLQAFIRMSLILLRGLDTNSKARKVEYYKTLLQEKKQRQRKRQQDQDDEPQNQKQQQETKSSSAPTRPATKDTAKKGSKAKPTVMNQWGPTVTTTATTRRKWGSPTTPSSANKDNLGRDKDVTSTEQLPKASTEGGSNIKNKIKQIWGPTVATKSSATKRWGPQSTPSSPSPRSPIPKHPHKQNIWSSSPTMKKQQNQWISSPPPPPPPPPPLSPSPGFSKLKVDTYSNGGQEQFLKSPTTTTPKPTTTTTTTTSTAMEEDVATMRQWGSITSPRSPIPKKLFKIEGTDHKAQLEVKNAMEKQQVRNDHAEFKIRESFVVEEMKRELHKRNSTRQLRIADAEEHMEREIQNQINKMAAKHRNNNKIGEEEEEYGGGGGDCDEDTATTAITMTTTITTTTKHDDNEEEQGGEHKRAASETDDVAAAAAIKIQSFVRSFQTRTRVCEMLDGLIEELKQQLASRVENRVN